VDFDISSPQFWIAVLQIIAIDIVLGGDNAVVIALACRHLPERQRNQGIIWGVAGAIGLRVVLIFFALHLLAIPFLKVVGAALLVWIGVKMMQPEPHGEGGHDVQASATLLGAIKTIIVADAVMSLDNVIAIAGAAKGSLGLVIFGLVVSVPIILWGSRFVLTLMDRFPVVVVLGAALLGWIAGDMTVTDVAMKDWMTAHVPAPQWVGPIAGALLVVAAGKWLASRAAARRPALVELGAPAAPAAEAGASVMTPGLANRILVPVDASDNAARAVEYVLNMRRAHPQGETMDIHLINVQGEVPADISRFIAKESIEDFHRENSTQALARARKMLEDAGVKFSAHMLVGKPWEVISEYASASRCDLIVMGTRGLGLHTGALLGSVSLGVAQRSTVPVLLVK
jgi:YjbE family integral membrane protein